MIVFFDGVCVLCNSFVDFLFWADKKRKLKFASLQGKTYQALARKTASLPKNLDTIIVWDNGTVYTKSRAVIKALEHLGGIWILVKIFKIIPVFLSDLIYDLIARFRYKIFGRRQACRLPTTEEKERFLD